ncbi:Sulfotransferase [Candidatus Magnetomoraceae bacterium gMMP-1]
MSEINGPILITGVFRSGTTLITQILKNHSNINIVYDSVNFMRFCYDKYNPISEFSNAEHLVLDLEKRILERWNFNVDSQGVLRNLKDKKITYSFIYELIMKDIVLKNSEKSIWGEKTTLVWTKIDGFLNMFPNGRVIHVFRDPRGVVGSWKTFTHASGKDYLDAISNCISSMQYIEKQQKDYKYKRFYALKFEDLLINPESELKRLCKKLDLNFESKMLDTEQFTDKKGNKWHNNSIINRNIIGISIRPISIWKKNLKDWEIWLIEFFMSDLMTKYGYDLENLLLGNQIIEKIIYSFGNSKLLTNFALTYLFQKKGYERFPTDPLNPKNWEEETVAKGK